MIINISRVRSILYTTAIICCLLALVLAPLGISIGRKIFYWSFYISLAGLLININKSFYEIKKEDIIISISILLFGLVNILWVFIYKPIDGNSPIYPILIRIGKILVMSSFLYLFLSSEKLKFNIKNYILLISVIINLYVFYEHFSLGIRRAELGTERATIAAYIISIISSLALSIIFKLKICFKPYIALCYFIFSLSAIILTQTRAAIITFPLLSLLMIIMDKDISKKNLAKTLCICLIPLIGLCFLFKSTLESRYNEMKNDIFLYQQSNSNSSIGARFAMVISGLKTGHDNIYGQSAENRTKEINQLITNDGSLFGAGIYTNVHLHNEIVDNLSIKGIVGVISLLLIYMSLLYSSLRNGMNISTFIITLSIIIYGLSDVLFFSKEFTFTFILCLIMSNLLGNKKPKINYDEK